MTPEPMQTVPNSLSFPKNSIRLEVASSGSYQPANHQPFRQVHIVCYLWALHGIFTSPTFAKESPETTEILEGLSLPIVRLAFASRCQTRGPSSHPIAICQTAVQSATV